MLLKRLLLPCAVLIGFSHVTWADIDPEIAIDVGSFSQALMPGINDFPLTNGGGVVGFYNPSNSFITYLQLSTTVDMNLSVSDFQCASFQFFMNCMVQYDNGALTFTFSGVNPEEVPPDPTDPEDGHEFEGIPTLMPGCETHPDTGVSSTGQDCTSVGHFGFSLNDGFSFSDGATGSWNTVTDQTCGDPAVACIAFDVRTSAVPEPSTWLLLGTCGLGLVFTRRFLRS